MMELYEGLRILLELCVKGEEGIVTKEPIMTILGYEVRLGKEVEERNDEEVSNRIGRIKRILDRDLIPLLPEYENILLLIRFLVNVEPVLVGMEELEFIEGYLTCVNVRNVDHYLNVVLYDKVIKTTEKDYGRREMTVREYMERQLIEERKVHERHLGEYESEKAIETRVVDDVYMSREDNKRIIFSYDRSKTDYHSSPLFQEMLIEYPDSLTQEMVLWYTIPIGSGGNSDERYYELMEEYGDYDSVDGKIDRYGGMDIETSIIDHPYYWCDWVYCSYRAPLKKEYREYVLKYQRKLYKLMNTDVFKKVNEDYERYKDMKSRSPMLSILKERECLKATRYMNPSMVDEELFGELCHHSKRRIEEIDEEYMDRHHKWSSRNMWIGMD